MKAEQFKGRVALITGSSRGIGNSIAKKFALKGADVILNYRKEGGASQEQAESLHKTIEGMGRKSLIIQADIGIKESVKHLFSEIRNSFGSLDFLILNAARAPFKPFEKLLERELRQLVDTNFLGNIFCIQEALPLLEKTNGRIVFISSLGSRFYNPSYPLGAMKAAMETVVRDCAESLRHRNISVNGICGGLVKTDSFKVLRQLWDDLDQMPEDLLVEPDEIADVVMFLCSEESRGICGQTIVADRGLSNRIRWQTGKMQ